MTHGNDGSITPYTTNGYHGFSNGSPPTSPKDNNGQPEDDSGHGTHNAGIIAAQVNNLGVAGVAGMWATRKMAMRFTIPIMMVNDG